MRVFTSCDAWDGAGESLVPDAAIAVEGEDLVAVGPRAEVLAALPPDVEQHDLGGRTVMPGLIDAHVHLQFPLRGPGDFLLTMVEPLEFTVLKAARNAQVYLAAGITTVFDCGCRGNLAVALREAIAHGLALGPRIVASGMGISPTGGWADEHASFTHCDCPQGTVADTPDEWRRIVRRQIKEGVDNIKIGVAGSALNQYSDPNATDMSQEEIELVVELAHRANVMVAVHCDPKQGFLNSVRAGVDTIHHGKRIDEECIEALAASPTYFMPTAVKIKALIEDGPRYGRPAEALTELARGFDRYMGALAKCVEAGLSDRLAAGSDAGNLPPTHGCVAREVAIFRDVGMSAPQALRTATSVAARSIQLDHLVGTLEPGKKADFIAVDGNPLDDVRVLDDRTKIAGVWKGGELVAERGGLVAGLDLDRELKGEAVFGRHPRVRPPA